MSKRRFASLVNAVATVVLALTAADSASAAVYNFNVTYFGSGKATLVPGSDNMLGVTLFQGDTFNYTITAAGGGSWTSITDSNFAFRILTPAMGGFALLNPVVGTDSLTYAFKSGNTMEFSGTSQHTDNNGSAIGPFTVNFPSGLTFNTFTESMTITHLDCCTLLDNPIQFFSIMPGLSGQAPEIGAPRVISFTPGVPEPTTWAMLLIGFVGLGYRLHHRHRIARVAS